MPDREKVMSWLEGLADDDWRQYHSDSEVQEIAKSAMAFLREQEPVEPIERNNFWYCGACKDAFARHKQRYCSYCGRKVKWDAAD